jgi:hypothetical protein
MLSGDFGSKAIVDIDGTINQRSSQMPGSPKKALSQ